MIYIVQSIYFKQFIHDFLGILACNSYISSNAAVGTNMQFACVLSIICTNVLDFGDFAGKTII